MNKLPLEQPPEEGEGLTEWLTRMFILLNGVFQTIFDLETISSVPSTVFDGMMRFFNSAAPPEITYPGPWVMVDGVWRPMTPDPDGYSVSPVEILNVADFTIQNPVGTDIVTQIIFGAGSGIPTDEAMVDANGTVTINYDGWVDIIVRVNVSRSTSNQSAKTILSYDINGNMSLRSQLIRSFSSDSSSEFTFIVGRVFTAGDIVKFYQTRDSSGVDDGGLYSFFPTLMALGDVPSAVLSIQRQIVEV